MHSFLFSRQILYIMSLTGTAKSDSPSAIIGRCFFFPYHREILNLFEKHRCLFVSQREGTWMNGLFVFHVIFFPPSVYVWTYKSKYYVSIFFLWLKLTFMLHPHPKQYPFPMAPKKYSFIKENVIIGKRKWKFQFGVVVARRKKISNISRRSAAKRERESQFLPPRAAGGPLKENSI